MAAESRDSTTELARAIVDEVLQDSMFKGSKSEPPNGPKGDGDDAPVSKKLDKGKQKLEEIPIPAETRQEPPTRSPSPFPVASPIAAYTVKTIQTDVGNGSFSCPILIQNENGPCPLLALCTPTTYF